jgi:hypothetical protein
METSRATRRGRRGGRNIRRSGGIVCRRCGIVVVSLWLRNRNGNVRFSSSYIHISPCWRKRTMPSSLFEDDVVRVDEFAQGPTNGNLQCRYSPLRPL